jgi:hypothetical protein
LGDPSILSLGKIGNLFCSLSDGGYIVPSGNGVAAMKDMQAQLEKLRTDAADCALIRDLATDPKKRELFARLAEHLSVLAAEVERAVAEGLSKG